MDRYENITIFTKLRELNFLVNSHLKIKNDDRVVRFVYMLRDGLFVSKNRTKFFDFVLPIDSKNIYRVCGTDYPEQVLYLSEGTDAKERKEKLYDCSSGNQRTGKDRTDPAE